MDCFEYKQGDRICNTKSSGAAHESEKVRKSNIELFHLSFFLKTMYGIDFNFKKIRTRLGSDLPILGINYADRHKRVTQGVNIFMPLQFLEGINVNLLNKHTFSGKVHKEGQT